jgi:hypothetical protein
MRFERAERLLRFVPYNQRRIIQDDECGDYYEPMWDDEWLVRVERDESDERGDVVAALLRELASNP